MFFANRELFWADPSTIKLQKQNQTNLHDLGTKSYTVYSVSIRGLAKRWVTHCLAIFFFTVTVLTGAQIYLIIFLTTQNDGHFLQSSLCYISFFFFAIGNWLTIKKKEFQACWSRMTMYLENFYTIWTCHWQDRKKSGATDCPSFLRQPLAGVLDCFDGLIFQWLCQCEHVTTESLFGKFTHSDEASVNYFRLNTQTVRNTL